VLLHVGARGVEPAPLDVLEDAAMLGPGMTTRRPSLGHIRLNQRILRIGQFVSVHQEASLLLADALSLQIAGHRYQVARQSLAMKSVAIANDITIWYNLADVMSQSGDCSRPTVRARTG